MSPLVPERADRLTHPVPLPALQAGTQAIVEWCDNEVAAALTTFHDLDLKRREEQSANLEWTLQNCETKLHTSELNLLRCEKDLEHSKNNEAKLHTDLRRVSANLEQTNTELACLGQTNADMAFVSGALKSVGITLLKEESDIVWRQLLCDGTKDSRWRRLQQEHSNEYQRRIFDDGTSQSLDAIAAINILLDANDKHATEKHDLNSRCNVAEGELEQAKKELEMKNAKIAQLEATIVLLKGAEEYSEQSMCISPTQLLRDPSLGPTNLGRGSNVTLADSSIRGRFSSPSSTLNSPSVLATPFQPDIVAATLAVESLHHSPSPLQSNRFSYVEGFCQNPRSDVVIAQPAASSTEALLSEQSKDVPFSSFKNDSSFVTPFESSDRSLPSFQHLKDILLGESDHRGSESHMDDPSIPIAHSSDSSMASLHKSRSQSTSPRVWYHFS